MTGHLVRALLVCALFPIAAMADPVETDGYWSSSYDGQSSRECTVSGVGQCCWYIADSGTTAPPILSIATSRVHVRFDNDVTAAQGAGVAATAAIYSCAYPSATSCGEAADPPIALDGAAETAGASGIAARWIRAVVTAGAQLSSLMVCGE